MQLLLVVMVFQKNFLFLKIDEIKTGYPYATTKFIGEKLGFRLGKNL